MRRFNRDYALVNNFFDEENPNWVVAEAHDCLRLEAMATELRAEGWNYLAVIQSDLPRSRAAQPAPMNAPLSR